MSNMSKEKVETPAVPESSVTKPAKIHYLSSSEASAIEKELLNDYKFSELQLAELGGLSVATAVSNVYPAIGYKEALVICGSDASMIGSYGLAAAMHLKTFGYNVTIHYFKHSQKQHYSDLLLRCQKLGIKMMKLLPPIGKVKHNFKVIVDAFNGNDDELILGTMINADVPVCSIDVPSGWDIEKGPLSEEDYLKPALLISIGAPKMCSHPEHIKDARHFLGGRFIAPQLIKKYDLVLPNYPDVDQTVDMGCFGPCCRKHF